MFYWAWSLEKSVLSLFAICTIFRNFNFSEFQIICDLALQVSCVFWASLIALNVLQLHLSFNIERCLDHRLKTISPENFDGPLTTK